MKSPNVFFSILIFLVVVSILIWGYVEMSDKTTETPLKVAGRGGVIRGTRYEVIEVGDWQTSENYCRNKYGGHLASIHTEQDQTDLQSIPGMGTISNSKRMYWVGWDFKTNTWTDGTVSRPGDIYHHFITAPINPESQHCLFFAPLPTLPKNVNVKLCTDRYQAICKIPWFPMERPH